jgi:hypothetical protein
MDPDLIWKISTFIFGLIAAGGVFATVIFGIATIHYHGKALEQTKLANEYARKALELAKKPNWDHSVEKVSVLKQFHIDNSGRTPGGVGREIGLDANATEALFKELQGDTLLAFDKDKGEKGRWELSQNGHEFLKILLSMC